MGGLPLRLKVVDIAGKVFGWIRPFLAFRHEYYLRYLEKETSSIIEKYRCTSFDSVEKIPKIIWLLWWQGSIDSNEFISKCVARIKSLEGFDVRVLTKETVGDYINISDILPYKDSTGLQFISDLIRFRLLGTYGGIWLDISTFLLRKDLFDAILDYPFYTAKILNIPKWGNISGGRWTSFFMASKKNNPLMFFINEILTDFLIEHGCKLDYVFIDFSMAEAYRNIPCFRDQIDSIPVNNDKILLLCKHMSDEFSLDTWKEVEATVPMLKFSIRKMVPVQKNARRPQNSYYDFIMSYDKWND